MFLQLTSNEEECGCVSRTREAQPLLYHALITLPPGERGWWWGWRVDVDSGQFSEHLATSSSNYNSRPAPPPSLLSIFSHTATTCHLTSCAILYSCSCSSAPNNLLLTESYKFVTKTYW